MNIILGGLNQLFLTLKKFMVSFLGITAPATNSCLTSSKACAPVLARALPQATTQQAKTRRIYPTISSTTLKLITDSGNVKTPVETTQLVDFTPTPPFPNISQDPIMTFSTVSSGGHAAILTFHKRMFIRELGTHPEMFQYLFTGPGANTARLMIHPVHAARKKA